MGREPFSRLFQAISRVGRPTRAAGRASIACTARTATTSLRPATGTIVVWGDGSDHALYRGKGDDDVKGGAGDDCLERDRGNDSIYASDGHGQVRGLYGDDSLAGDACRDQVNGEAGTIRSSAWTETMSAPAGMTTTASAGAVGDDDLDGDADDDSVVGDAATTTAVATLAMTA
jgi:hypothetical protein